MKERVEYMILKFAMERKKICLEHYNFKARERWECVGGEISGKKMVII
jgi:hypothetical protein